MEIYGVDWEEIHKSLRSFLTFLVKTFYFRD